ncbi:MAG: penicillin-binding protein 2 [Chloroflexota bacterium]|nr:MAG: penicillin-binding protein 2 [Chloroflexota bacterium]
MSDPIQSIQWRPPKRRRRKDEARALRRRFLLLRGVIMIAFLVLAVQLWRLQVVEGQQYRAKAEENRLRLDTIRAPRGVIYDRNRSPLVRNVASFTVGVVPAALPKQQREEIIARAAALLGMPPEQIISKLEEAKGRQDPFTAVPIKRNIDRTTAFTIEEQHDRFPGVVVAAAPIRQYPFGPTLSHVLGYVGHISAEEYATLKDEGYRLNDEVGKAGVETTFESYLHGRPGSEIIEVDATERKVGTVDSFAPVPGKNLVLSIDAELQKHVMEYLQEGSGSSPFNAAVVLDPRTGEVLALVSLPSFDNNLFSGGIAQQDLDRLINDPRRPLFNYAIGGMQAPGSTFKVITAAAALQEKVVTPQTRIQANGQIQVRSEYDPRIAWVFRDWSVLGSLDLYRGIAMSSNVYFFYLGGGYEGFQGLGIDRLAAYAHRFGIGEPTNIDIPGEAIGLMPDPSWKRENKGEDWTVGDTYNSSIGQGDDLATPLQMANVAAAIANGGTLYKPQIVREIVDEKGQIIRPFEPQILQNVGVSPENLREVQRGMLEGVRTGIAKGAAVPGFELAGKTGTAEFGGIDPRTGQQYTHGWFIGYAPYDDPRFAVAVFQYDGGGGQTAVPVAQKILAYALNNVKN